MKITTDDLHQAIEAYAVMLNRPHWLDPGRADAQHGVWLRMVARAKPTAIRLRPDDIEWAITDLLDHHPPHAITPSAIIHSACGRAAQRDDQVLTLVWQFERGRLLEAEIHVLASDGDVDGFKRRVADLLSMLMDSDNPFAVQKREQISEAIVERSDAVLERFGKAGHGYSSEVLDPNEPEPEWAIAHGPEDRDEQFEELIGDWLDAGK